MQLVLFVALSVYLEQLETLLIMFLILRTTLQVLEVFILYRILWIVILRETVEML